MHGDSPSARSLNAQKRFRVGCAGPHPAGARREPRGDGAPRAVPPGCGGWGGPEGPRRGAGQGRAGAYRGGASPHGAFKAGGGAGGAASRVSSHRVASRPEAGAMLHWGYDEHNGTGVGAGDGGSRSCPELSGEGAVRRGAELRIRLCPRPRGALRDRPCAGFAVLHSGAGDAGAASGSGCVPFCCAMPGSESVVSRPRGDCLGFGLFCDSPHLSDLGIAEVLLAEGLMPLLCFDP